VNDLAGAAASRKVIITAEEIVPEMDIRLNKKGSIIPFFYADAVVELPYGALPGSMPGYYYWPRQWWEKLMRFSAINEENIGTFLDEWIFGTKNQIEFLEKLGGAKWMIEARRQTKAAEGDNEDIDFSYQEYTVNNDPGIFY
jgi:glutaconate CoA-transferase subunit A